MKFDIPLNQKKRQILHVDADAFFASVEQILDPSLKGKAVLVGAPNSNKGIVSACSYEAKEWGVKTGMPLYLARRKCPHAVVARGHFEAYRDFSSRMYRIFMKCTPHTEMASIDEAYLDISGFDKAYKKPPNEIARSLLMEIYRELGLSVSCGLASNKTVAKVASSLNKPHKLTVVPFGKERDFLKGLELRDMPGIGPRTFAVLERFGFRKIGDFADLKVGEVVEKLGIGAIPLWKKCRGFDNSNVIDIGGLPKSISKENTFYNSITDICKCTDALKTLSGRVFKKLRSHDMRARIISIRIRYKNEGVGRASFEDHGFQKNLGFFGANDSELFPHVKDLFMQNVAPNKPIRLLGIGVSGLRRDYNLNLFGDSKSEDKLFTAIDTMKELYGEKSLSYGVEKTLE
ncbi:DNA polymerase IV [Candidatus Peregrinibacteria bacterium]|nr:DNA polymerase IV [Candidatus Peregrinibacteria bacterium]MBT7736648.1 DNA polymerase IV [Candidatus Peregrinibacteria bacterium]